MLNDLAVGIYALVALLCWAIVISGFGDRAVRNVDRRRWAAIATLFLALAVNRLTGFEETSADALRVWIASEGQYDKRRIIQGPLTLAVLAAFVLIAIVVLWRAQRRRDPRERACGWATAASAAMIALVALRTISFHPIDALLYEFKLNWVVDMGSSLCAAGAALASLRSRGYRAAPSGPRQPDRARW